MSRVLPQHEPMQDLPAKVTIYEVGARDGLQNEKGVVPTQVKAEFVRRLLASGLQTVETTSFVSPKWVPQLADATELLADLDALVSTSTWMAEQLGKPSPSRVVKALSGA